MYTPTSRLRVRGAAIASPNGAAIAAVAVTAAGTRSLRRAIGIPMPATTAPHASTGKGRPLKAGLEVLRRPRMAQRYFAMRLEAETNVPDTTLVGAGRGFCDALSS